MNWTESWNLIHPCIFTDLWLYMSDFYTLMHLVNAPIICDIHKIKGTRIFYIIEIKKYQNCCMDKVTSIKETFQCQLPEKAIKVLNGLKLPVVPYSHAIQWFSIGTSLDCLFCVSIRYISNFIPSRRISFLHPVNPFSSMYHSAEGWIYMIVLHKCSQM